MMNGAVTEVLAGSPSGSKEEDAVQGSPSSSKDEEAPQSSSSSSKKHLEDLIEAQDSSRMLKECLQEEAKEDEAAGSGGPQYQDSALVWVRLGQSWWPGRAIALHRCPKDFVKELKKTPLAVVKFFEEQG